MGEPNVSGTCPFSPQKEVSVQNKFKFILEKEGKKQLFGISEQPLP